MPNNTLLILFRFGSKISCYNSQTKSSGLNSTEEVSNTLSNALPELQSSGDKDKLSFPTYFAELAMDEDVINESTANELLEVLTNRHRYFYCLIISSIPIYFSNSIENSGQQINNKSLTLGVVFVV
jgi:hypothetical protein